MLSGTAIVSWRCNRALRTQMNGETEGKMRGSSRLELLKWQGDGSYKGCPRHSKRLWTVVDNWSLSTVDVECFLNVIVYVAMLDTSWEFAFFSEKRISCHVVLPLFTSKQTKSHVFFRPHNFTDNSRKTRLHKEINTSPMRRWNWHFTIWWVFSKVVVFIYLLIFSISVLS